MPDSLIVQFVNNAWDDIQKKVSDGLAFGKQKTLSDVVTVVTESCLIQPGSRARISMWVEAAYASASQPQRQYSTTCIACISTTTNCDRQTST
jgi:hypothetical protein